MTNKTILSFAAIAAFAILSIGTAFAAGGDFFNLQNNGEQILMNKDSKHPAIELRDLDGDGTRPYIDFANDPTDDFDARIVLSSGNTMKLLGADLKVDQKIAASNYCNLDRTQCYTVEDLISSPTSEYDVSCSKTTDPLFFNGAGCSMICDPNYGITNVQVSGFNTGINHVSSNEVSVTSSTNNVGGSAICVRTG